MADTHLNLTQAAKAAGITRRTLYNHINQGKVTASRDVKNNPVIDVSELIRVYGNVSIPVKKIPKTSHCKNTQENFTPETLEAVRRELSELKASITLLLEDKVTREQERQRHENERLQLQEKISKLTSELDAERHKGFWSRIFKHDHRE